MRRVLLFLVLALMLSACGSDDIEISYSGQINGELEARGAIICLLIDGNKVPFLSFLSREEDNGTGFSIFLVPGITTGEYQFTDRNIQGEDILFRGIITGENGAVLDFEDLISGELTLTQLPDVDGGWVEGEFDVVYPDMTILLANSIWEQYRICV